MHPFDSRLIQCSMIFCFSDREFDSIVDEYGALVSPNDIVILSREIAGYVDLPAELSGKSSVLKDMAAFSRDKEIVLIVSIRAKIGERIFNSSALIDKGHIFGVCDEINPPKGYVAGKVARSFLTSRGKICVFVDSDVCYPALWQSCLEGCRYVFSVNSVPVDRERITCAKALALASGKSVLMQFCGAYVCINPYGKVESVKFGEMAAFYLPLSLARGKKAVGKIKFVEEKG